MVAVYKMEIDSAFAMIAPEKKADGEMLLRLKCRPMGQSWTPIRTQIVLRRPMADFLYFAATAPAISRVAWEAVEDMVRNRVEPLVLSVNQPEWLVFNVTRIIDCLDHTTTRFVKTRDGIILSALSYGFREQEVIDETVFRVPELYDIFATERFKARVLAADLHGLTFTRVGQQET